MSASEQRPGPLAELAKWHGRQWVVAVASSLATVLFVGIPTDLIDTSMFSRQVPPPWWSYPSLAVSSVLAGLLIGTYATGSAQYTSRDEGRWGGFGGVLALFRGGLSGVQQSRPAGRRHLRRTPVLRACATAPRTQLIPPAGLGAAPSTAQHTHLFRLGAPGT